MSSTHDPHPVHREAEIAEFVWIQIRVVLEKERDRIYEEIRSYPPPIAACDEQFNYLLEQRAQVSRDLARMNETARTPLSLMACSKFLDELVASSDLIAGESEQKLRSYLRGAASIRARHHRLTPAWRASQLVCYGLECLRTASWPAAYLDPLGAGINVKASARVGLEEIPEDSRHRA
jgi:hypothetical protein